MAIRLVHKGTTVSFSTGDDLDPVNVGVMVLDNSSSPPITDTNPALEVELLAQVFEYTDIGITMVESENFVFLFSLTNSVFTESLTGISLNAIDGDVRLPVWVKARTSNSQVLTPGIKITDKIEINYTVQPNT